MIEIRGVRLAAGGVRLIRRSGGIAVDQVDAVEGDRTPRPPIVLRRRNALTEFFLAAERRDASVGRDREPRVDLISGAGVP